MSIMIGLWHFDGSELDRRVLERITAKVRSLGSLEPSRIFDRSIGMMYHSFGSLSDLATEVQPHVSKAGTVMMWDGRLDNREEVARQIAATEASNDSSRAAGISETLSDVELVHSLFDRRGADCLCDIVGDWALSIWDANKQRLTLACDFCGVRHLYYCRIPGAILWCTDLGALVSGPDLCFKVSDSYIVEYLEGLPDPGLTPYSKVLSVIPGHSIEIEPHSTNLKQYWSWTPSKAITYSEDGDYEDHLRHVLRQSVQRRLRSPYPVVAELSGGIDSSSIVCLADDILLREGANTPALHTLSYFHDDEPTCDERPYFSVIERKRGVNGTHINSARYDTLMLELPFLTAVPQYPQGTMDAERDLGDVMQSYSSHTLLSGIGGDEFLGGAPTGIPELADLLYERKLGAFWNQLAGWSMASQLPRWDLLLMSGTVAYGQKLRDPYRSSDQSTSLLNAKCFKLAQTLDTQSPIPWIGSDVMPSQRMFVEAWCGVLRLLAYRQLPIFGCYDITFPYLDRDLLSFLFAIPRTQVIRLRERRSLMRRALRGLVPSEILWRKSKATAMRRYIRVISSHADEIRAKWPDRRRISTSEYIDPLRVEAALGKAGNGIAEYCFPLLRGVGVASWLDAATGAADSPSKAAGLGRTDAHKFSDALQ